MFSFSSSTSSDPPPPQHSLRWQKMLGKFYYYSLLFVVEFIGVCFHFFVGFMSPVVRWYFSNNNHWNILRLYMLNTSPWFPRFVFIFLICFHFFLVLILFLVCKDRLFVRCRYSSGMRHYNGVGCLLLLINQTHESLLGISALSKTKTSVKSTISFLVAWLCISFQFTEITGAIIRICVTFHRRNEISD